MNVQFIMLIYHNFKEALIIVDMSCPIPLIKRIWAVRKYAVKHYIIKYVHYKNNSVLKETK
jgi:hypothetical protein